MKPDLVLGFDPAPGSSTATRQVSDALRAVVRHLTDARAGIDGLARTGSVWEGAAGAPIGQLLRRYGRQLRALEDALVDCLVGLDTWRTGLDARQQEVGRIVEQVADLRDDAESHDRRTRLIAAARELGTEHDRAAGDLAASFEEFASVTAQLQRADDDLAGELDRALLALTAAVEDWMAAEAPELLRTAIALGEVAGLTTVISELIGIAALGRNPGEAEGVSEIIARSPGSHRLIRALRKQWLEVAPDSLPAATFAIQGTGGLADVLAGRAAREGDPAEHPGSGE